MLVDGAVFSLWSWHTLLSYLYVRWCCLFYIFGYFFILQCLSITLLEQAVLKQFTGTGPGGSDNVVTDETELQLYQKLEKLFLSTRSAKVFPSLFW